MEAIHKYPQMAFQILSINQDESRFNANGPLSDLSTPDFEYNTYSYPIVQNPDTPDQGHNVIFYQNTPQNSSWAAGSTTASSPTPVANRNVNASSFGLRNPATDPSGGILGGLGIDLPPLAGLILQQGYKRTTTAISLYIPSTMVFGQHASYENVSLTDVLGIAGSIGFALDMGANPSMSMAAISSLLGISLLENVASTADIRNVILQRQFNLADNPLNLLLFKQMDFRKFQFDFLLTPENQQESNNIQEIIYQFRFGSVPEVASGSRGRFFVPPNTWDIEFLHNGKVNTYVPKISTCFLESVNVDYAAHGEWVTHWDGSPVQTRLTLNFVESVVLTRDLIQQGF